MSELNSVHQHYEQLLADHYEWMFAAPVDELVARQKRALRDAGIEERPGGLALDLGCGSGFQSLALQELGYEVLALDNSEKLLAKLAGRAGAAGITTRLADIRWLDDLVARESFHVAVCMGDTLTHLPPGRMSRVCFAPWHAHWHRAAASSSATATSPLPSGSASSA